MITPCFCENEAAIRDMLLRHAHELVKEGQEIRIAWRTTQETSVCAILTGYEPPGVGEYADTLGVYVGWEVVYIITPAQITHFAVLATKRMTLKVAYQQMKEMERAAGIVSIEIP